MEPSTVTTLWQKSKVLIKALIIGILILLLMIPAFFVKDLIMEREATQQAAITEVSNSWAGKQNFRGPILVLPFTRQVVSGGVTTAKEEFIYLLPDSLRVAGDVVPMEKHRGIYKVMLYSSQLSIAGSFDHLAIDGLGVDPASIRWEKAYVSVGISDVKGLEDDLKLSWNQQQLNLVPSDKRDDAFEGDFISPVTLVPGEPISFSSNFGLHGSQQLMFTPVGKETTVRLASPWKSPSFTGAILPASQVSDSGFKASWKSLSHTRTFPQAWTNATYNMEASAFGADLYVPVNGYQKTLRSIKYAILCIVLTFAAFFLVETNAKKSIHPLQYALVGIALILFYTLLLSFSEYIGFNAAYAVATVATVGLITWFVRGLLESSKLASVIAVALGLVYSYIFTTLQLEDYSLLLGSIGLFISLAVIMRFSKKLKW